MVETHETLESEIKELHAKLRDRRVQMIYAVFNEDQDAGWKDLDIAIRQMRQEREQLRADVARLTAERDALAAELAQTHENAEFWREYLRDELNGVHEAAARDEAPIGGAS